MDKRICILVLFVLAAFCRSTDAAELFRHDDFQNGTTESWGGGSNPTNIPTGGPNDVGDSYLLLTSNGTNGPGSRLGTQNSTSAWTGDYYSVGAQRVAVDFANFSMSELEMRVVLLGPDDEDQRWTSTEPHVVPTGSAWSTYEFFLFETELTRVDGLASYSSMIQDVFRILLRHDSEMPSAGGSAIAAQIGIDNIRLLPGGDFDRNGLVDGVDVDALVAEIATGGNDSNFDIDGDGSVGQADLAEWLRLSGHLEFGPGRSFLPGDANLDGFVDGLDFIAWNENRFSNSAAWTAGDFNADGFVDGQDFIIWNDNKFSASDAVAVPEPSGLFALSFALVAFSFFARATNNF